MSQTKQSGGKREGAGRPKGSRNLRSLEAVQEIAERFPDWSPLMHMAAVANDKSLPVDVRLDAAKSAAPFIHAKAKPVELDPDGLVELEGRIHRARLGAAVELARQDPHLVSLAERLTRAVDRQDAARPVIAVVTPADPAHPIVDVTPRPAPVPVQRAQVATGTPAPAPDWQPPAPYQSPIAWPDNSIGQADCDYDAQADGFVSARRSI